MKHYNELERVCIALREHDNRSLSLHALVKYAIEIDCLLFACLPTCVQTPDASAWLSCEMVGNRVIGHEAAIEGATEYLLRLI